MTVDLMQYIEEEEQNAGGGGTFVCQAELGVGYLIYSTGSRMDRHFRVREKEGDREAKKESAKALGKKLDARSQFCVSLYLYADSVLNREETPTWTQAGPGIWAHDLPVYTDGWKKVLAPSIEANFGDNVLFDTKFWAQIDLVPDPYNEKSGKDNNVPMIVDLFDSKEDAIEALGKDNVYGDNFPEEPSKWDEGALGQWKVQAEDIVKHFIEDPDDDGAYFVMEQFGVDQDLINVLRKIAEDETIPF